MLVLTFLLFPLLAVTKVIASLAGLVVVALALPFAYYDDPPNLPDTVSRHVDYSWRYKRLPAWADWCWGNDKYGAEGNWFWLGKSFWKQYQWLALRNPANNLQRYSIFRFDTQPAEVQYKGDLFVDDVAGKAGWQLVYQGWRAGFYCIVPYGSLNKCLRIRLGYKIDPTSLVPTSAALSVLISPWANFGE